MTDFLVIPSPSTGELVVYGFASGSLIEKKRKSLVTEIAQRSWVGFDRNNKFVFFTEFVDGPNDSFLNYAPWNDGEVGTSVRLTSGDDTSSADHGDISPDNNLAVFTGDFFDGETFNTFPFALVDLSGETPAFLTKFTPASGRTDQRSVRFVSNDRFIAHEGQTGVLRLYGIDSGSSITEIAETTVGEFAADQIDGFDSHLWVATGGAVSIYDFSGDVISLVDSTTPTDGPQARIRSLGGNRAWTKAGIHSFDGTTAVTLAEPSPKLGLDPAIAAFTGGGWGTFHRIGDTDWDGRIQLYDLSGDEITLADDFTGSGLSPRNAQFTWSSSTPQVIIDEQHVTEAFSRFGDGTNWVGFKPFDENLGDSGGWESFDIGSFDTALSITGVSPTTVTTGTTITITGTGFVAPAAVTVGPDKEATNVVVNSTTEIVADAPAGSGTQNVTVYIGDSAVTGIDAVTYGFVLTLTSITPTIGDEAGGTEVTATGTFDTGQAISFTVGGAAATSPTVVDSTTATFVTPAGTGASNDVVATQGAQSDTLAGAFEYTAGTYASTIMDAAPTAYWRLDETTGTTVADETGTFDAPIVGTFTLGQPAPGTLDGNSIAFTNGDFEPSSTPMPGGETAFSIVWWVKPNVSGGVYIMSRGNQDDIIYNFNTGLVELFGGNFNRAGSAISVPNDNAWHMVAYTYDGTTLRKYLDGAEVGTHAQTTSYSSASRMTWGRTTSDGSPFTGSLDEVAVFANVTLSAAQIADLYNLATT